MGTQCPVGWAVVGHPPCLPVETPLCWGAEAPSLLQTPFPGGPPLSTREARARVSCSSLGPQRLPLVRARPRCLLAITTRPSSLPHPVPRLALSVSTPQGPPGDRGCPAPSSRDTCYCPLCFTSQLRPLVLCQHLVGGSAGPPTTPQRCPAAAPLPRAPAPPPPGSTHWQPLPTRVRWRCPCPRPSRSRQVGEAPASRDALPVLPTPTCLATGWHPLLGSVRVAACRLTCPPATPTRHPVGLPTGAPTPASRHLCARPRRPAGVATHACGRAAPPAG